MWYARAYNCLQAGSIDGTDVVPHDHAIKRALNSHYTPPKHLTTDPKKTIFVGRLNHDTTEAQLRTFFEQYGRVTDVYLPCNIVSGTPQGYAFISFEHRHDARDAYERAHRAVLDSHVLLVDYERSRVMKGWVPRRLGGGYGGKKESGQLRFGARDKPFRWPVQRGDGKEPVISADQRRSDTWRRTTSEERRESRPRSPPTSRRRSISPSRRHTHSSRYKHSSSSTRTSLYSSKHPRSRSPSHRHQHRESSSPYNRRSPSSSTRSRHSMSRSRYGR